MRNYHWIYNNEINKYKHLFIRPPKSLLLNLRTYSRTYSSIQQGLSRAIWINATRIMAQSIWLIYEVRGQRPIPHTRGLSFTINDAQPKKLRSTISDGRDARTSKRCAILYILPRFERQSAYSIFSYTRIRRWLSIAIVMLCECSDDS